MEDQQMLEKIKNMALGETMGAGAEMKIEAHAHELKVINNSLPEAIVRPKERKRTPSDTEEYEEAPSTDSESEIKMAKTLAQLQGENVKLRKERDSYKRRAQSMVWENNLFLTENKWRKAKSKLDNPPSEEKRANVIGVAKEILDQNKILALKNILGLQKFWPSYCRFWWSSSCRSCSSCDMGHSDP